MTHSPHTLASHVHVWEPPTDDGGVTLVLLHGTGGDERDLLPFGRMLLPRAGLLGIRGNVLEHGAPRFFRRLAEGVFDVEDLHRRTAALGDFIAEAASRYAFDASRAFAVGFSNGANVAASLLLSRPGALAGGLLFRAMVPFEPARPPALKGTRVLLSEGRTDPLVPPGDAERLAEIFRSAGADVVLEWQAGGHQLAGADVKSGQNFLGRGAL